MAIGSLIPGSVIGILDQAVLSVSIDTWERNFDTRDPSNGSWHLMYSDSSDPRPENLSRLLGVVFFDTRDKQISNTGLKETWV